MIGKLILYALAGIGALTVCGGGFVGFLVFYFGFVEPMKAEREEKKQHKTNLKALRRHWEQVALEEH